MTETSEANDEPSDEPSDEPRPSRASSRFWDALLLGLLIVVGGSMTGAAHWALDLLTHFQVYYFASAFVLLIVNGLKRRRAQLLLCAVVMIVVGARLAPYFTPAKTRGQIGTTGQGRTYTILLLNLNLANKNTAAVQNLIRRENPDFLVLQEVTQRWRGELKALEAEYAYSCDLPAEGAFGLWLLSRSEPENLDVLRKHRIAFLNAKYRLDGRSLELVALHPFPPVGAAASRRRNEILQAAAKSFSTDGGRIAVGDLNCSPWSPHFKDFLRTANLRDSALGRGIKATWFPLPRLGLPIDHHLVSRELEVVERRVGPDVGSDHRPVKLIFRFAEPPP